MQPSSSIVVVGGTDVLEAGEIYMMNCSHDRPMFVCLHVLSHPDALKVGKLGASATVALER